MNRQTVETLAANLRDEKQLSHASSSIFSGVVFLRNTNSIAGMCQGEDMDETERLWCGMVMDTQDRVSPILNLEMQCKAYQPSPDNARLESLVQTICSLTVPTRHCVNVASKAHLDATGQMVKEGSMDEAMIMLACGHSSPNMMIAPEVEVSGQGGTEMEMMM
jgi:hypothetical protein